MQDSNRHAQPFCWTATVTVWLSAFVTKSPAKPVMPRPAYSAPGVSDCREERTSAFTVATDVQVYFCDPQSPRQRGTHENTSHFP
jgi:hypothetical protein